MAVDRQSRLLDRDEAGVLRHDLELFAQAIEEAKLTHAGDKGGFFTLILNPPDRVQEADIPPRELIFVMDTSGSMRGFPINKSKEVINKAIDAMRPADTFNVITFAGHTAVLWSESKPADEKHRAEAQDFINNQQGGGGTEMMKAIDAALVQAAPVDNELAGRGMALEELANLPADGREVIVSLPYVAIAGRDSTTDVEVRDDLSIRVKREWEIIDGSIHCPVGESPTVTGTWSTIDGKRVLICKQARWSLVLPRPAPMRIVLFLTDGYVGNDMAIIDAVRKNADTTRVFSFGIGNSVNRYLLDGMAKAGRGEAEFVLLESDSDAAVERFTKRVETPVLTDINLAFSDGLEITDTIPPIDQVRDLFDVEPLIIHGRYSQPGVGTLTITGNTGGGPYRRVLDLELHEQQAEHDVIATLWARAKVEQIMNSDLKAAQQNAFPAEKKQQVVALGEEFRIMTQYTSFVAVEKSRTTIDGQPVLVAVPIEMPSGVSYEGVFGGLIEQAGRDIFLGAQLQMENKWRRTLGDSPYPESRTFGLTNNLSADETEELARIMQDEGGQIKDVANSLRAQNQRGHVEYEADMQRARERLTQGAYAEAANVALTARIRLNQDRQFLNENEFRTMADAAEALIDEINAGRRQARLATGEPVVSRHAVANSQPSKEEDTAAPSEEARIDSERETARLVDEQNRSEARPREQERQRMIDENIRRVRQLQMELKYDEALQVLDQTLFIDEHNTAALALKEVMVALKAYRQSEDIRRGKDWSYNDLFMAAQRSSIAPSVNYGAKPGNLSTNAILEYPRDWSELSLGAAEQAVDDASVPERYQQLARKYFRRQGLDQAPSSSQTQAGLPRRTRGLLGKVGDEMAPLDKSGNMRGRSAEIQALVQEVLRDAETVVGRGFGTEGYDDGAVIQSADGNWRLKTNIHMQNRAIYNNTDVSGSDDAGAEQEHILSFSADLPWDRPAAGKAFAGYLSTTATEGDDDDRYGFDNTRTKFILSGNVVSPDWLYKITINDGSPAGSDRSDSRAGTGDAWIGEKFVPSGKVHDPDTDPLSVVERLFSSSATGAQRDNLALGSQATVGNTPLFGDIPLVGDEFKFESAPALDLDAALNQSVNGGGRGFGGGGGGGSGGVRDNLGLASGSNASVFDAIAETDEDQRLTVHEALKRAVEIMAYRNAAIELGETEATAFDDEGPGDEQPQTDVAAGVAPAGEPADDIESAPAEAAPKAASPSISLIEILFAHAGRPLLAPELVILINTFMQEGDIEVASQLAEELAAVLPQYEVAVKLHEAFTSEELDDAQRAEAVVQLAAEAHAQMIATINAVLRHVRIENVLDERLRPFAAASGFPEEATGIYDGPTPMDTEWVDGGILLTVKTRSLDQQVIETLEEYAKLVVKTTVERDSFIVGVVPLGRLDDLALIPEVVWVEPARVTPNDG